MTLDKYQQCAKKITDLSPIHKASDKDLVYSIVLKLFAHKFYQRYQLTSFWLSDMYSLNNYLAIENRIPKVLEMIIGAVYWRTRKISNPLVIAASIDNALDEIATRWLCDRDTPVPPIPKEY